MAELVDWGDVLGVEVAVVDEDALAKVLLGRALAVVGIVEDVGAVVLAGGGPAEGGAAGLGAAVEDVDDGAAALLAGETSPEDGRDVGVVVPVSDEDGATRVYDDNGLVADAGDVLDQGVARAPEGEVVAIALVAVDADVALAVVGVDKDESVGISLRDESLDR